MKRRKGLLDEEKFLPPLPEQLPRGASSLLGFGQGPGMGVYQEAADVGRGLFGATPIIEGGEGYRTGQALANIPPIAAGLGVIKAPGKAGQLISAVSPKVNLQMAAEAAEKIGQSANPYTRSLQQGFEHGWYHGTTGDITSFRKDLLGESTGAQSARKGFFFARDPANPPQEMLTKSPADSKTVDMLKKLGIPEEQIAKLNTVSMEGHGAETASGYAKMGGSRQYKEAMRKASIAEKKQNWDEYEKQMTIAEDIEISRQREIQGLVAKYGDARDEMLNSIQNAIYSKQLPQQEAERLDQTVKSLMPYGWYNSYSPEQFSGLKKEIVGLVGEKAASPALKKIDDFLSVKNERALAEHTSEGGNVMPVALTYKNPLYYDFKGSTYRDQTYADLLDQAIRQGNDAVILKNTYDPGAGPAKLIDVGVVFNPNQVRSKFAAFDPTRLKEADLLAGIGTVGAGLLSPAVLEYLRRRDEEGM